MSITSVESTFASVPHTKELIGQVPMSELALENMTSGRLIDSLIGQARLVQSSLIRQSSSEVDHYFSDIVQKVRQCVDVDGQESVAGHAHELIHEFISNVDRFKAPGAARLYADAIFQECIPRFGPKEIWQVIDYIAASSKVGAEDVYQDILLKVVSDTIEEQVSIDDFDSIVDEPSEINLLRAKSLAQLLAYMGCDKRYEASRKLVDMQLEQLSHTSSPLINLYAQMEIDNVELDRDINGPDANSGLLLAKHTAPTLIVTMKLC